MSLATPWPNESQMQKCIIPLAIYVPRQWGEQVKQDWVRSEEIAGWDVRRRELKSEQRIKYVDEEGFQGESFWMVLITSALSEAKFQLIPDARYLQNISRR